MMRAAGLRPPGHAIVRAVADIVPDACRDDWADEWLGELAAEAEDRRAAGAPEFAVHAALALRALGTIPDALWLRRHHGGSHVLRDDLRLALRSLVRRPAFSAIVIATLALSIGATVSIFTVVSAVLLRELPYPDADRLAMIWSDDSARAEPRSVVSVGDYLEWRDRAKRFDRLATYFPEWNLTLTGDGPPDRLEVGVVSANLFETLGIAPLLGRTFQLEEEVAQGPRAAVLSHGYWSSRFGGDAGIIGRDIALDGEPYTVIGVLGPGAQLPDATPQLYVTLPVLGSFVERRQVRLMRVVGRLAPEASVATANAELAGIARAIAAERPATNAGFGVNVIPLRDELAGDIRRPLLLLLASAAAVLLIGCANVANLMLVRGMARAREFALRTALGARRGRLVRQLLTESGLIAAVAGIAGIALAFAGVPALVAMAPDSLPRLNAVRVDGLTLAFGAALALGTAVAFGMLPALRASRVRPAAAMSEGSRGSTGGRSRRRLREALVAGEIAVAVVLLVGAALLLTSFVRLIRSDAGFVPEQVVAMTVSVSRNELPDPLRRIAFFEELQKRIARHPGVASVGAASRLPLDAEPLTTRVYAEGARVTDDAILPEAQLRTATIDYFRTMGIPVLRGRGFTESDGPDSGSVLAAVVTRAFAREILGEGDPVGRRVRLGGSGDALPWFTIVGVVGDLRDGAYRDAPQPQVFRHAMQAPGTTMQLVVRGSPPPDELVAALRRAAGELASTAPVYDVRSLETVVARSRTSERFLTMLVLLFAGLGVVLAGLGIYGVMASAVTDRTPEIGIRIALGATPSAVLREVLGRALFLTSAGLVVGALAAAVLTRALSSVLYDVTPGDPRAYLLALLVLGVAAALAASLPARRASAVDPLLALRAE
jgi:putative ABC transport system permease protein